MPFVKTTRIDITPTTESAWVDRTLSDYVTLPAGGVTGVQLEFIGTTGMTMGYRKNGSTTEMKDTSGGSGNHFCGMCGVDTDNIFEVYTTDNAYKIYLTGYTTAGFTFFTDPIDMGTLTANSWTTLDCSSHVPSVAIALIFIGKFDNDAPAKVGMRNYGSSDDLYSEWSQSVPTTYIMGCTSQKVQYMVPDTSGLYLAGFIDADSLGTFFVTKSTYNYTASGNTAPLPTGAYAGVFEFLLNDNTDKWDLREASAADPGTSGPHTSKIVSCDATYLCNAYYYSEALFYLTGWFLTPGGAPSCAGGVAIGDYMIF